MSSKIAFLWLKTSTQKNGEFRLDMSSNNSSGIITLKYDLMIYLCEILASSLTLPSKESMKEVPLIVNVGFCSSY